MLLTSCGVEEKLDAKQKKHVEGKPKKLIIWEEKGKGVALEPAMKSFEQKYGIKVEYKELELSAEMKEKIRLDGPAGTGPDILTLPHDQVGQLALEGMISPIKVNEKTLNAFTKQAVESQKYDSQLYGLPKAIETPIFLYNKKLMKTPPKTMDDLYEFSIKNQKKNQYGFLASWDNLYFANAVLTGMGGYIFERENDRLNPFNIGLNNGGAIKGAAYIQKWYQEGLFPKGIIGENGVSTLEGLFAEGKVASVMSGPWAFQSFKEAGITLGASKLPNLPNGQPMKTFIGVKGWSVNSFSKYKKWSTKLIEHLTNYENAKIRYEKTEEIPPVLAFLNDPLIQQNEKAKAIVEQAKVSQPMPNSPEMNEVWGPMNTALQLIANSKQKPKEALTEAVETIQNQIKANHGN
ncbi:extracellular solute-binding protein [Priestia megaterium]|uniref:extracellular solute-binding protein n=1 Tax=Priestia megaterium TaxID=1404 RepID=UPI00351B2188